MVDDLPDANGAGVHTECRAGGMLYKLTGGEDWEEPLLGESSAEVANVSVLYRIIGWQQGCQCHCHGA